MKLETYNSKQADFDTLLARKNLKNTPKIIRKYNKILKKIEKTATQGRRSIKVYISKSTYGILVSILREDGYRAIKCKADRWIAITW